MIDLDPLFLTFKLALLTTIILLLISIPFAYWLAYTQFKFKAVIETIVSLPLVLPPSVLGFYLLLAFSPENAFGKFCKHYFNTQFVFTFQGLLISSVLYSLPFMVHPLQTGFKSINKSLIEASYILGKSKLTTLLKILLPNMRASLFTGIVLTFAHTIGEFGVVLMVGGNIPNKTRVVSIAIYDEVQSMNYHNANIYSIILLTFSFLILLSVYIFNHRSNNENLLQ